MNEPPISRFELWLLTRIPRPVLVIVLALCYGLVMAAFMSIGLAVIVAAGLVCMHLFNLAIIAINEERGNVVLLIVGVVFFVAIALYAAYQGYPDVERVMRRREKKRDE